MEIFHMFVIWYTSVLQFAINEAALSVIKWNKHLETFEPIYSLPSYEDDSQEIISPNRQDEARSFQGETLRVSFYQNPGIFEFSDNDTKVSGIYGDLWMTLADSLNFTLAFTKVESQSLWAAYDNDTSSLDYPDLEKTDIIPVIRENFNKGKHWKMYLTKTLWIDVYTPYIHGKWELNRGWMIDLFSAEVWYTIFGCMVIFALASIIAQKVLIRQTGLTFREESYWDHFFFTFMILFNQGCDRNNGSRRRTLSTIIYLFSWMILVIFSSCSMYVMTLKVFREPFKDWETMLRDTNFQLLVANGSYEHMHFSELHPTSIHRQIAKEKRVTVMPNSLQIYETICTPYNKNIFYESADVARASGIKTCDLRTIGNTKYFAYVTAAINQKWAKYKTIINSKILKLHESGILSVIRQRNLFKNSYISQNRYEPNRRDSHDNEQINMEHVSLVFAVLALGMIASIVICVCEIIYASSSRRRPDEEVPVGKQMRVYRTLRPRI